jgi:hypothetical protein
MVKRLAAHGARVSGIHYSQFSLAAVLAAWSEAASHEAGPLGWTAARSSLLVPAAATRPCCCARGHSQQHAAEAAPSALEARLPPTQELALQPRLHLGGGGRHERLYDGRAGVGGVGNGEG